MRLKLILAYVGSRYSGWQIQEKPSPPPTVQGTLESALRTVVGQAVRAHAAGRTDAGVHAHGQVAHADIPDAKSALNWQRSLNALLPQDIRVLSAAAAPPGFHARKDALRKTYIYHFWQERAFVPPHLTPFVWPCGPLDADAMREGLAHLPGTRDFSALRNAGTDMESSVRTVFSVSLCSIPPCEYYPPHAALLRFTVVADGFLKQMVRNMAGLLAACGQGKIPPDAVPGLLAAEDRRALPSVTAPAQGLALARVDYAPTTA